MKRNHLVVLAILCLSMIKSYSQNVAINEDGSLPNPNAILDVKSFTKGLLIPRVSTTGRLAIPNTKGLLVYDSTVGSFWYNDGANWQNIAAGNVTPSWSLTGNTGTNASNFIGNIDDKPLFFRIKNIHSGRIEGGFTNNTFLGFQSGAKTTDLQNTGIGAFALAENIGGHNNTAAGCFSLASNVNGINNTAVGAFAQRFTTSGFNNTAIGDFALNFNTMGFDNTASGNQSLQHNTIGNANTGTGTWALNATDVGHDNTANGAFSLINNTNGNNNTAMGSNAMLTNVTGSSNTAIGAFSDVSNGVTNATAIGFGAISNASNKVRIGNGSVTKIEGQVGFTVPSDGRYKYNIEENVRGLDFIMQLRPVTYQFDVKRFDNANPTDAVMQASYDKAAAIRRSGFIAQEVEKAANATGYDFSGISKPQTADDHYSLSYEAFVVPLVKAVQEQQKQIEELKKEIKALKNK